MWPYSLPRHIALPLLFLPFFPTSAQLLDLPFPPPENLVRGKESFPVPETTLVCPAASQNPNATCRACRLVWATIAQRLKRSPDLAGYLCVIQRILLALGLESGLVPSPNSNYNSFHSLPALPHSDGPSVASCTSEPAGSSHHWIMIAGGGAFLGRYSDCPYGPGYSNETGFLRR